MKAVQDGSNFSAFLSNVNTCVLFSEFQAFESAAQYLQSRFLLGFVTGDTGRTL